MSTPQRPLIDRRRSSSRDRVSLSRLSPATSRPSSTSHLHPADNPNLSRASSTGTSAEPSGSTTPTTLGPDGRPLKSVLKHNHIHPDPKPDTQDDEDTTSVAAASEATTLVDGAVGSGSDLALPSGGGGHRRTTSHASAGTGAQYRRRVGFDTMVSGRELEDKGINTGGGTAIKYSFTVSAKSAAFERTKWTRTFLCGTDLNEYSRHALQWLLESLMEDNDEVVVLRVIDPGSSAYEAWKKGPNGMEEQREEAESLLEEVMRRNGDDKQISIIVEFAVGPIEESIHRMIEIYKPDSMVVGTRGRPDSLIKSAFIGSISKYCVARSPVPTIVVRPDDKVKSSLEKRVAQGAKRSYVSLLGDKAVGVTGAPGGAGGSGLSGGTALERTETAPAPSSSKGVAFGRFGTIG